MIRARVNCTGLLQGNLSRLGEFVDIFLRSLVDHCISEQKRQHGLTKVGPKLVFLDLRKNGWRYSLAVKTLFLGLYISYLNPELEHCSCQID